MVRGRVLDRLSPGNPDLAPCGPQAPEELKIGSALARATCSEESVTINNFMQKTSILHIKGNLSLILNRLPRDNDPPWVEND